MERYYRFAGVEYLVRGEPDEMYTEERTLAPFSVKEVWEPHVFRLEKAASLPAPEGECVASEPSFQVYDNGRCQSRYLGAVRDSWEGAHLCAVHQGKEHTVYFRTGTYSGRISAKSLLGAMEAEHLIARAGGFVFHCACIDREGRAVLFTAPSETGKSTQAELWKKYRGAEIINGDRAAVRIAGDEILAEGIPFAGSSVYCKNRSLPLDAIVYLGQAPVTSIRRLRGYEAFCRIWEGCSINTWDREDMALVSEAVRRVAETIPVFYLPCTPDESAIIALENALKEAGL